MSSHRGRFIPARYANWRILGEAATAAVAVGAMGFAGVPSVAAATGPDSAARPAGITAFAGNRIPDGWSPPAPFQSLQTINPQAEKHAFIRYVGKPIVHAATVVEEPVRQAGKVVEKTILVLGRPAEQAGKVVEKTVQVELAVAHTVGRFENQAERDIDFCLVFPLAHSTVGNLQIG